MVMQMANFKVNEVFLDKMLDDCKEGKVFLSNNENTPSEFSFILDKRVNHGYLNEIDDDEMVKRIISEFEQVSSNWYIQEPSTVYKYSIWNGMDYELSSESIVYSTSYYTQEEFDKMCQECKKANKVCGDFDIASYLCDKYDFSRLKWAHSYKMR